MRRIQKEIHLSERKNSQLWCRISSIFHQNPYSPKSSRWIPVQVIVNLLLSNLKRIPGRLGHCWSFWHQHAHFLDLHEFLYQIYFPPGWLTWHHHQLMLYPGAPNLHEPKSLFFVSLWRVTYWVCTWSGTTSSTTQFHSFGILLAPSSSNTILFSSILLSSTSTPISLFVFSAIYIVSQNSIASVYFSGSRIFWSVGDNYWNQGLLRLDHIFCVPIYCLALYHKSEGLLGQAQIIFCVQTESPLYCCGSILYSGFVLWFNKNWVSHVTLTCFFIEVRSS